MHTSLDASYSWTSSPRYNNATSASWLLNSTATPLFDQPFAQSNTKENIMSCHDMKVKWSTDNERRFCMCNACPHRRINSWANCLCIAIRSSWQPMSEDVIYVTSPFIGWPHLARMVGRNAEIMLLPLTFDHKLRYRIWHCFPFKKRFHITYIFTYSQFQIALTTESSVYLIEWTVV